ncbi:hypothetical protein [Psychrobacillus sp. OK032]|uniref:hypothetical protein n=1 Tax=Psychrobacillus sp. OK032 TaxID=1884358 RepID=UPI0008D45276|nr:hypothetical protein [Psychrobacillus sp. OK032]SES42887.1 hypothetical protein SAMN05518872_111177 [Psychrobacillus sp. OK032]
MRKNWSPYVWKLLWTVGLIVLLIISYKLELQVKNHVATTFKMLPIIWFQFIASFILGIYLSLLFIKKWSVKWNWSLIVCVTIPFLIISIYLPITITFVQNIAQDPNNYSVPFPFWLMKINTYGIPAIVAGLTLIIGLFSNTAKAINNE